MLLGKGKPIIDTSLVFHAPLGHLHLKVSPFTTIDPIGHTCTVTGAIWTPQGRIFNGVGDRIVAGNIGDLTEYTVIAWVKWVNSSNYENVFHLKYALNQQKTNLTTRDSDTVEWYGLDGAGASLGAGTLQNNEWVMMTVGEDGSEGFIDLDGGRLTATGGTGNATPFTTNLYIGTGYDLSVLRSINAVVGEIIIYSRRVTSYEIRHNYLVTKWRYQ